VSWQSAIAHYTPEQLERLEAAAAIPSTAARIEKAAFDLTNSATVDGIDITELWPFVLRRREQLAAEPKVIHAEATLRPVEPLLEAEPVEDLDVPEVTVEEPAEEPQEAPAEEAPKPAAKKRAPRKSAS
jgi:hypothetical protein